MANEWFGNHLINGFRPEVTNYNSIIAVISDSDNLIKTIKAESITIDSTLV